MEANEKQKWDQEKRAGAEAEVGQKQKAKANAPELHAILQKLKK